MTAHSDTAAAVSSNQKSGASAADSDSCDVSLAAPLAQYFAALRQQTRSNTVADAQSPAAEDSTQYRCEIPIRVSADPLKGRTLIAKCDIAAHTTLFIERPFLCTPDDLSLHCLVCDGARHHSRSCAVFRRLISTQLPQSRKLGKLLLRVVDAQQAKRQQQEQREELDLQEGDDDAQKPEEIDDDDVLAHVSAQSGMSLNRLVACLLFVLKSEQHKQQQMQQQQQASDAFDDSNESSASATLSELYFNAAECLDQGASYESAVAHAAAAAAAQASEDAAAPHPRLAAAQLLHSQALPKQYRSEWTAARLYGVLSILDLNSHAIHDAVTLESASALLPFFAMIEHSCAENCCFTWCSGVLDCSEPRMCVRTLRDVTKGESLSINYCAPMQCAEQVRRFTRQHYGFECQCIRCSGSEQHDALRAFQCLACAETAVNVSLAQRGTVFAYGCAAQGAQEDTDRLTLRCNSAQCAASKGVSPEHRAQYFASERRILSACGGSVQCLAELETNQQLDLSAINRLTTIVLHRHAESQSDQSIATTSTMPESVSSADPTECASFALLAPSHYLVHAACDCIISLLLSSRMDGDEEMSQADYDECCALQQLRIRNIKLVTHSDTHWSLGAEFDRLAYIHSQCSAASTHSDDDKSLLAAREAQQECARVNRLCFGEQSDMYRGILAQQEEERQQELEQQQEQEAQQEA